MDKGHHQNVAEGRDEVGDACNVLHRGEGCDRESVGGREEVLRDAYRRHCERGGNARVENVSVQDRDEMEPQEDIVDDVMGENEGHDHVVAEHEGVVLGGKDEHHGEASWWGDEKKVEGSSLIGDEGDVSSSWLLDVREDEGERIQHEVPQAYDVLEGASFQAFSILNQTPLQ